MTGPAAIPLRSGCDGDKNRIRSVESMKNTAPFSCPKCGEEKGWRCLNDPED